MQDIIAFQQTPTGGYNPATAVTGKPRRVIMSPFQASFFVWQR
jgi:hypothetical protein